MSTGTLIVIGFLAAFAVCVVIMVITVATQDRRNDG